MNLLDRGSRSRRHFLKVGSAAIAGAAATGVWWPRRMWSEVVLARATPGAWGPTVHALLAPGELAARAIEAAQRAGATYADVNIVMAQSEYLGYSEPQSPPAQDDTVGVGVRALVNGYWGFASMDGIPTPDVAARLGVDATAQAQAAARGRPRTVELGTIPVATGSWATPVEIDPFTVSWEEKLDYQAGLSDFVARVAPRGLWTDIAVGFQKETRVFASTEGAATFQTLYQASGNFTVMLDSDWTTEQEGKADADGLTVAGAGWEYILRAPLRDQVEALIAMARIARRPQPVDIGRYDVVFDANAAAHVLAASLGNATQLDRAMGYRANTVGTSYLTDPLEMAGHFQLGSPLLTLTTQGGMPGGVATVKWDCEGVEPRNATLVNAGILTDFQTTREAASWLAPYYQRIGQPVQSNGCAGPDSQWLNHPIVQETPNLVMQPGSQETTFEDLVKDTKKGMAIFGGESSTDFQALNGSGRGALVRKITNGVLGPAIDPVQYLYRSPEFWKHLVGLGGPQTARKIGVTSWTGRPCSISAVPIKVTGVAMIDPDRKA